MARDISPAGRFAPVQIALHWLVVAMMVSIYVAMECRGWFPKDLRPTLIRLLHYSFGITVLFLLPIRLALRLAFPTPPITPTPPLWQERTARAMHLALYAFMLLMPLLAWTSYSLRGKPVWFYGFDLPGFLAPDDILRKQLKPMVWHERIAELGYWLIGLHAAAALFHHYVVRDDTLRRMLGSGRPSTG